MNTDVDSRKDPPPEEPSSTSDLRRWLLLLLGILIGGFFLYLTARNVDLDETLEIMAAVNKLWLLPLVALVMFTQCLRGWRWYLMFPENERPRLRHTIDALMIGKLGNNFMPGRLGDVLRATIIGPQVPGVGASGALATIVIEKVFDSLAILIFMGIVLLVIPLPDWIVNSGSLAALIFLGLLFVLWLVNRARLGQLSVDAAENIDVPGAAVLRLASKLLQKFSAGLYALQHARHFTWLSALTLIIWTLEIVMFFLWFQAFGITAPLLAAMVCLVFLALGLMLPAAPGFIGTYQLFIVAALKLFDVPETTAFALAVFLNLFTIGVTTIIGILVISVPNGLFSFSKLREAMKKTT